MQQDGTSSTLLQLPKQGGLGCKDENLRNIKDVWLQVPRDLACRIACAGHAAYTRNLDEITRRDVRWRGSCTGSKAVFPRLSSRTREDDGHLPGSRS